MTSGTNHDDELIAIYSNPTFSSELAAKIFFSEHSENEVTGKLHELANLQGQIELILRQKVRENYSLFMHANSEINRVGVEMRDLKLLIEDTKKMLLEVRNAQSGNDHRSLKLVDKKLPNSQQLMTKNSLLDVSDTIPTWVRQAPQELDRLIIEQQYQQAVTLIKRTLAFLESIKDLGVESANSPTRDTGIRVQIEKRSLHLAEVLRDSLARLPNSQLWGMSEQTKRLQLLVKLGHKDIAAQGFSTGQKDMIRKAMRYVEASGDVEKFTSELSRVFFSHLREACTSFMDLFSTSGTKSDSLTSTDEEGDMASLSYLVGWIQEQMSVFVTALARQIQLGAAENRSKVFEQNVHTLRNYHQQKHNLLSQKASRSRPGSTRMSRSAYDLLHDSPDKISSPSLSPEKALVRTSSASAAKWGRTSLATSGYNTVRGRLASMSTRDLTMLSVSFDGPLTFTSRCLQVAYKEAMVLDQLGLQAGASLSWHIIPEIKSIINSFTDDIIREMETEVSNDDWTPIRCSQPEVKFPGKNGPSKREMERNQDKEDSQTLKKSSSTITSLFGGVTFENEDDNIEIAESNTSEVEIYTSSSYDWIVAIMTYFIGEVLCLLQVDSSSPDDLPTPKGVRRSMSSDFVDRIKDVTCSRIDLCELDPEIAACLLRIVVRYVKVMMNVQSKSLTYECLECFHKTVEEISVSLLPSVEDVITKGFFSDGSTLVLNPPKVVFASLRRAIDTLQREL